ncbi:hypothetical protein DDB_G0278759 [Dictyostelium discoideum AX4]|uniref:Ankyrin repeat-containing protein n=1 Tax=Dictyostelium discoideum TaxID=44689 RepID=Q54XT4_DICDI|nr:hypothetical protein DDB_G0278759 [Dictyostelium discoideum AX4]EAL67981.1 hypothetical protein DDB_G0278759 [Dictyostelium discoideum AX4]|eukprot:XP_641921.1 hypothetical protein DDB_G0278759 [Dictyostelium discoideum AX4]
MKIKEINDEIDNQYNNILKEVETITTTTATATAITEEDDYTKYIYSNIFKHLNKGEMDQCIELIEKDHSLVFSTEDHYGMTILHLASQKKMRRLVKRILDIVSDDDLLSTRFNIDTVDLNNNTALHYACTSSINDITTLTQQQQQQQQQQQSVNQITNNNSSDINSFMYLKEKKSNRFSIVKLLLERGASSSISNKMNLLPIHLACKEVDFKIVELLIENHNDYSVNMMEPQAKVLDSINFSLLFQSLQTSSDKFLTNHEKERNEKKKEIILSKIDPNLKCIKNGPNCLHYSLSNLKRIKEVTLSLFLSFTNNSSSSPPPPPTSSSSSSSSSSDSTSPQISQDLSMLERNHPLIKLIKLLLQKSCKPNHIDETTGKSPFHQLIDIFPTEENDLIEFFKIDDQQVQQILQQQPQQQPQQQRQNNNNNSNFIIENHHKEEFKNMISNLIYSITRLFQQYKYDFTLSSRKSIMESDKDIEETPLGQCCIYPTKKFILEQILNFFKNHNNNNNNNNEKIINSINSHGQPALFIACSYGNVECVDLLLENGADPNIKDKYGSTMLHESLNFKHYEIVKKLVLCGANVNEKMSVFPQSTPLHIAASQLSFEMCHFFVEHGALLNVFDSEKQTPKDIILQLQQQQLLNDKEDENYQELKDFFEFHIQINLIEISSFVVFKGDYKKKIREFIHSKERNSKIVDKYMNQIFNGGGADDEEKLDQLVSNSDQINIPLKEIKSSTKRIKIKSSNDTLFKYVNLYNQTFNHLLHIIQNRFKPSTTTTTTTTSSNEITIEQFEKNFIKSITLLPNVSLNSKDDQNLDFLRDDDEIVVEFY